MSVILVIIFCTLLAGIPLIEVRGSIPIAMSVTLWGENALSLPWALAVGILGSSIATLVAVFIFIKLRKFLCKHKFFYKCFSWAEMSVLKVFNKNNKNNLNKNKFWIIFSFCALPLPFSGIWGASILGSVLNYSFGKTVLAVLIGNLIGCLMVTFFCAFFVDMIDLVIVVFGLLTLFGLISNLLDKMIKNSQLSNFEPK